MSYICRGDVDEEFINWRVSCPTCTSEICQPNVQDIGAESSEPMSVTLCSGTAVVYDYVRGVSNLNITLPRPTTVRHLEINCESSFSLHIAGI